jgi:hypothetical protein
MKHFIILFSALCLSAMIYSCNKYDHSKLSNSQRTITNPNVKIVMLGDSETRRINHYWGPDTNWNTLMGFDTILNYGYDAWGTWHMLYSDGQNSPLYLAMNQNPDLICLMIGANDAHSVPMNMTGAMANYRTIIDSVQGRNIDLVVQSIIPSTSSYVGSYNEILNTQLRTLNDSVRTLCLQRGVPYLDVRPGMVTINTSKAGTRLRDDMSVDGIHLNYAAYEIWKGHLMQYLIDNGYL